MNSQQDQSHHSHIRGFSYNWVKTFAAIWQKNVFFENAILALSNTFLCLF